MFKLNKRTMVIGLIIAVWLATSACSCSDLFADLVGRQDASQPSATSTADIRSEAQRGQTAQAQAKTATPRHTLAPTLTRTPVPNPSQTPTEVTPTPVIVVAQGIPTTPNTPFDVTLTEEQISAYVAGRVVSQSGVEISDPQITLGDGEVLVHIVAYHEASDIRVGLTVRGAPVVFEGALYVRVDEVILDDSIKGFARLLARTVIDAAIGQYSGEHGIAIPVEQVAFESIEVTPGQVRLVGRTR